MTRFILAFFLAFISLQSNALTFPTTKTCVNPEHTFRPAGIPFTSRASCFTGAFNYSTPSIDSCALKCTNGDWFSGSNSGVNTSCPTNSTLTSGSCSPNSGYSAVQSDTGTWTVKPSGSECESPLVYNELNGLCILPVVDCSLTNNQVAIRRFTRHTGCSSGATGDNTETCTNTNSVPSFDCVGGCQYNSVRSPSAVHGCYSDTGDSTVIYCDIDFKSAGTNCSDSNITLASSSSTGTPTTSTPITIDLTNSGGINGGTSQNPNPSFPSTGGTASNNTGTSSTPITTPSPTGGTQQVVTGGGSTEGCIGCATESTQAQVLNAVTNVGEGVAQPDFNSGIEADDLGKMLVSNDAIQGMFKLSMPAHNRTCPTAVIEIPFFSSSVNFNSHCVIMQDHYNTIRSLGITAWIIMAILVILGA